MGPPFEHYPSTPGAIRGTANGMSTAAADLDAVMTALDGPSQAAADAVDGELDGKITVPVGSVQEEALASAAGARVCRGAVDTFADCVELFDKGVDDINERWKHAKANDFFVPDDADDRKDKIADARSEEEAALRAEYRSLEETLDSDAETVADLLLQWPSLAMPKLEAFQSEVGDRAAMMNNPEYVALGDSYSAGTGAGKYKDYPGDGPNPYRSENAYPELLADRLNLNLDHRAVNGATTTDIQDQLHTLGPDTEYVTITAGGNNVGFGDAVRDSVTGDGTGSIEESRRQINEELPEDLDALYAEIRARAPNATIVVGTYPQLVDGEGGGPLSNAEETAMNEAQGDLTDVIEQQADEHGFEVADVTDAFDGHESDVMSQYYWYRGAPPPPDPWIHGLSVNPFNDPVFVESYHPNKDGHEAYADEFEELLD
ncbi:SGNH/GDSL hydrolase family protein [Nocardioidaceae bacterium SCSIO 66511]|nr:SGNH/GDSL hydrolase family protein [Nocardioidaceae bacterium SCSIO 66511]